MTMQYPDRLRFGFVLFLLLASLCPLSGQALEPTSSNQPPLNEKDFFAYKQKGRSSLTGQAFLSSPSGKAITQAGAPIHLIPITPYTRYWFDHQVKTTSCSATGTQASTESTAAQGPPTNCAQEALTRLQTEKRLAPYLRTTRANPTGHFWFTKVPAGRYYIVSQIEGGSGTHQEERLSGLAWLVIELEAGEKATNLVVTDCKASLC